MPIKSVRILIPAVLALALPAPAQADGCAHARSASLDTAGAATICLLNEIRADRGLAPLRSGDRLQDAARGHAADMARRNYFSHVSLNGDTLTDRLRAAGVVRASASYLVGENLAWGSGRSATPAAIVRMWMNSPPHRANILRAGFRRVGIGAAAGAPTRVSGTARTFAANFSG